MKAKSGTIWFSGLHGSGKTSIAKGLAKKLRAKGIEVVVLDGDELREGVSADLGYTLEDRNKHIKRVANICAIISKNNVLNIACVASPSKEIREYAKSKIPNFIEVFVNCPLKVCEERDVKGHYKKARAKEEGFEDFLGIGIKYEAPENPGLVLETDKETVEESVEKLYKKLVEDCWVS
ncbi:MAG: adenylyl-sulfate kinase [archaeon]|nr:adenylyl-sulfate kinase [archaeon]